MKADIQFSTEFPHGTPDGFKAGCRGAHCPAVLPCRDVHRRYVSEFGFRRQIDAGVTLEVILEREAEAERAAAEAARIAKAQARARGRVAAAAKPRRAPAQKRVSKPRKGPARYTGVPTTQSQAEVLELYAQGLTDKEMAARLGKSRERVQLVRRRLGLEAHKAPTAIERIRELHAQGMNDIAIAEHIGRAVEYVSTLRRNDGLPLIPYPRTMLARDEVIRLHAQGLTDQEMADHFGVPRHAMQKRRTYIGLPVNPARGKA